jgi:hypothetical protein
MGLQYKILYKKGQDNKVADALSRKSTHDEVHALSIMKPRWLEIIEEGYLQDDNTKQLLTELAITPSNQKGFTLVGGLIKYKGRVWLGSHKEAHQAVMMALQDSGIGGHGGIAATYNKIRSLFAWPNTKQAIKEHDSKCQVCQQARPEHGKLPGLLQLLPVPHQAWQIISMDFF